MNSYTGGIELLLRYEYSMIKYLHFNALNHSTKFSNLQGFESASEEKWMLMAKIVERT